MENPTPLPISRILKHMSSRTRSQMFVAGMVAASLLITAAILHAMGRVPYCTCGLGFGTFSAWGTETSQHLVDPYSLSHVLHGILFFAALWLLRKKLSIRTCLFIALWVEIGWEILENSPLIIDRYRANTASLDYYGDSILNATGDILSMLFGFWLASKLRWYWSLVIIILLELGMLYFYRDNLTLNVLMLVWPIDAVREWQMAR